MKKFVRFRHRCDFTLIELLVNMSISALHFLMCSDKLELQNTSLFLKKGEGLGEGKNLFSREKKFFPFPREPFHFNRTARRYCDNRNSGGNSASCPATGTRSRTFCELYE